MRAPEFDIKVSVDTTALEALVSALREYYQRQMEATDLMLQDIADWKVMYQIEATEEAVNDAGQEATG